MAYTRRYLATEDIEELTKQDVSRGDRFEVSYDRTPVLFRAFGYLPTIERLVLISSRVLRHTRYLRSFGISQGSVSYRKKKSLQRLHVLTKWSRDPEVPIQYISKIRVDGDKEGVAYLKLLYSTMSVTYIASLKGVAVSRVTFSLKNTMARLWKRRKAGLIVIDNELSDNFWRFMRVFRDYPRIFSPLGDLIKEQYWNRFFNIKGGFGLSEDTSCIRESLSLWDGSGVNAEVSAWDDMPLFM